MSLYEPNNFAENDPVYELGAEVLRLDRDGYGATVHRSVAPDDTWFIVSVTDYVANEWRYLHASLAAALAHLSVIEFCDAVGVGVTVSTERLATHAQGFHHAVTWLMPTDDD